MFNIWISGVLPRIGTGTAFFSKVFCLDTRLMSLCSQEGVNLVNLWQHFYMRPEMFAKDGLRLNDLLTARFGRLLAESTGACWSTNATQMEQVAAQMEQVRPPP